MLYRVIFAHIDAVYEIYVRKINESELFGFLVVEDFVFGKNAALVVDPNEEKLKIEFSEVKRSYIPMQAVFRIDEVSKEGPFKVRDKSADNVSTVKIFPMPDKDRSK
jgi:hypothetical protein